MVLKNIPFALALGLATAFIVGCGENSDNLTKEERAWIRRKLLEEKYGGTSTVTQTATVSVGTTVTLTTTVNVAQ